MGATVLNQARIGANCLVGANALVTEGKEFPDNSLIVGVAGEGDPGAGRGGHREPARIGQRYVGNWKRFAPDQLSTRPRHFGELLRSQDLGID